MNRHLNKMFSVVTILALMLMALPMQSVGAAGSIGLTTLGSVYTEDFNTIASSGTSSTVPNGWDFTESGTNANTTYTAGTGSSNAGDTYSFGAAGNAERAFGGLLSSSLVPTIGASFTNSTGSTITQLAISYTGEQWRLGATGRTDRLDFQYSLDATSLTTGTWVNTDELDFNGPISTGTVGLLDGNAAANRVAINFTITGLSIANGSTFWIRLTDFNASGADDGLSVDDFSLTPNGSLTVAEPKINEFVSNHVSTDTNEYVEIVGDGNTDYSAYAVLHIEGDGTGAGVIDSVHTVGTTDANGYWFTGFLNNALENGTITLLLVKDFSGSAGADLDMDNDGALDSTPWSALIDEVAVSDGGAGDFTYSSTILAPGFSGNPFTPGGASRIPDGTDTGSVSDWLQNDFDGAGLPGFTGTPAFGEAYNTPGSVNEAVAPPAPEVVINEIDYDQPGTDAAEFIEIRNNGDAAIDLTGWTLELVNGTGGGAAIYNTITLPAVSLAAGDYFVVCANAATVANCDLDSTPNTDFIQNGAPDAVGLRFNGTLIDAVSYEGDTGAPYTEGSGVGLVDTASGAEGISRCPDGSDTDVNNVDFVLTAITPGAANDCDGGGVTEAKIHEVQGSGGSVAITGAVTVEAIVVADYQSGDQLSGFFLQEEDLDADLDANTSEGIFVFCGSCTTDVAVGDQVEVTGQAEEFFGMSQIDVTGGGTVTVRNSGNTLPTPASINLPASGSTRAELTFEKVEGMLVTFTDTLFVSEYFELARFGQLVLTADARPRQFTDANEPSVSGYAAFLDELNSKRIFLDDDNSIQNDALGGTEGDNPALDEPYFWPRPGLSNNNFFRGGDSITGLTGVLEWSFGAWRVRPVEPAFSYNFISNNERPATSEDVGGSLKVASFNVLNYFTTINSRGADSMAELNRQREKTAAAICAMDADIVGLIEIENNGGVAINDLLTGPGGISAVCGTYQYIDTGVVGTDEIIQAFIYRPATVTPVGDFAVLDSSVDSRFNDDLNRPALAQTFQDNTTAGIFTVVVNHLKSKGSACPGDPDILDGQGNCNITRREAAAAMVDWLAADPTGSGDNDFLIMGDLNSYRNEDPIDTIEVGADGTADTEDDFSDLLDSLVGPSAYSFVFDGQLGYLDTGLVSNGMVDEVTGVTEWHINADEIPVFDYNDEIRDGSNEAFFERESTSLPIYLPNQYRSSDHDPIIIGLDVCDEIAPVFDELSVSPNMLWPPNHMYVDVTATVTVSDNFDSNPTITLVSVTSNEPDNAPGPEDGNTTNDIVIVDDFNFKLRAERSDLGTGRVYTITYMATDACGNSATQSVEVTVPIQLGD